MNSQIMPTITPVAASRRLIASLCSLAACRELAGRGMQGAHDHTENTSDHWNHLRVSDTDWDTVRLVRQVRPTGRAGPDRQLTGGSQAARRQQRGVAPLFGDKEVTKHVPERGCSSVSPRRLCDRHDNAYGVRPHSS